MSITVQQILQKHLNGFANRRPISRDMLFAAVRMRACRTSALGGHVIRCPQGHQERIAYNSCRHRSCPQCSLLPREQWLDGWKQRLLDCPHFHVVFTTPHELLPLWRYNRRRFADALFAAASGALQMLLADDKYLGARPGLLAALHTWSQTLVGHVHLHVLVTAGGLTDQGHWRPAKKSCLLPRKVLMIIFRGKLRAELRRAFDRGELTLPPDTSPARFRGLLNKLGRTVWNVKILDRYDHGQGVATYLARYLKGGALSSRRLTTARDGRVAFRYRHGSDGEAGRGRREVMNLAADEFIARLLQHVPPRGMQTVRAYGLYAGGQRARLNMAREAIGQSPLPTELPDPPTWQQLCAAIGHASATRCQHCGAELVVEDHFAPGRSPPLLGRTERSYAA